MKRLLSLAVLAIVATTPLAAQGRRGLAEVDDDTSRRRGFWLQAGLGAGREQLDLEGDGFGYSDDLWAPTVNLRAGGTLGEHVRLGGDLSAWFNSEGDYTESVGSLMPVLQLYPAKTAGLHVRGGGGYAWSSVTDEIYDATSTVNGFGTVLGAGWEFPVSRKLFLTPYVDWYQYWFDSREIGDFKERILVLGMAITFQAK